MFEAMRKSLREQEVCLVFPEGEDLRVIEACVLLAGDNLVRPIILEDEVGQVAALAKENNFDISNIEVVAINNFEHYEKMLHDLIEIRKGKNEQAELESWLKKRNYFGTMMVKSGFADGLVGGATYSTGDTVKPSLQIIKTVPGTKKVSSAMLLVKNDEKYIMGDCAINISPDSEDLASTAKGCAKIARIFGVDPVVGLLSFSTLGSASGAEVEKVTNAKKLLDVEQQDFLYDGEFQFDAAYVESVGRKKAPNSNVAGRVNTFVFPSLEAGNIGYKIAQRLGGYEAIGPVLIGLNAPINDLSRGCSVDEIFKLSIITAMQALQ